ncbi:MAG TPA: hypothetical protein VGV87_29215 [Blastocatellia bacterium]|nr:hypothetical protein [Blastocatellia bacterium]
MTRNSVTLIVMDKNGVLNPTHGSGWIVQALPTHADCIDVFKR